MWLVKLTGIDAKGDPYEQGIKLSTDSVDRLLDNGLYRWDMLELLLARGVLRKVEIDFRPNARLEGVRRIYQHPDGSYYLKIGNDIVGHPYRERGDAWASGETKKW